MDKKTAQLLMDSAAKYETRDFVLTDPSWFPHQVEGVENVETMAFIASALSYGSRKQFFPKLQSLLDMCEKSPHRWVLDAAFRDALPDDARCFYRLHTRHDLRIFLERLRALLLSCGSIGTFVRQNSTDAPSAIAAIVRWFAEYERLAGQRIKLIPHDTTSACKRVCMFLRWMSRSDSPVDFGLWSTFIDRRTLIMPLDTHVLQEASALGLMSGKSASMSAAVRLTDSMREIFPEDPLKGDFALYGLGISE